MLQCLFQPITIGEMTLRNRIVMAPMGTGYNDPGGYVSKRNIAYYAARARGGVGMITLEGACVDYPQGSPGGGLNIDDDKYLPGLSRLADAIKKKGAHPCQQLIHAGRYTPGRVMGVQPVAPSAIASRYTGEMPRELTTSQVEAIIEKFAEAGLRAKKAGFSAVELVGNSGYLISEFMSVITNKRTDRFGGDAVGRAAFLVEIVKAIRQNVGPGFPISCKLSIDECLGVPKTIEASQVIASMAQDAGANIIHCWAGWHESPTPMMPMSVSRGAFVYLAEAIKKVVSIPVTTVGRINDPILADRIIAEGKADLVAMGRALIADPELPNKAREGRFDEIRMCLGCCYCLESAIHSARDGDREAAVQCTVNAEVGREWKEPVKSTSKAKDVLIIGGGPAGMEAARMLAVRGHRPTIWERNDKLGGNLHLASIPPHKEEIANVNRYLSRQMQLLGVKVQLGKNATPKAILDSGFTDVIVATGAVPIVPDILGIERNNVILATEMLKGREVGGKVVVVGGGLIGCETAEFLAEKGKQVTIVEMLDRIGADIGPASRFFTLDRLKKFGVEMRAKTRLTGITESTVQVNCNGQEQSISADTVVLAVGMKAEDSLYSILKGKLPLNNRPNLYAVGDCAGARRIADAIHEGWQVAGAI
ncbi:MAG: FAD-dependent oxidoreductase [Dehalococcoidia bacterium]|nr:FAD-dependent oxidoreductase [Dehalococcoidia bacterium]